ncbi:uncharacterized protein K452DRAFT_269827 [Aplosporella prunicola CBS 121167]|uniref:C3H1-type domain-containing protein n=1 Tax=Aplosporella prunicola CBS 121167 TaxID=1176127 RepID=A0A6A6BG27_9PEZI|nr:uncharacterized protein K452DRAFT_269827 [Aplosporella prunicola CBS 121167]KAF2143102.1 hypothetical protein K452DRAFT_269827 [Aplosporella prunicola CBS 121167]
MNFTDELIKQGDQGGRQAARQLMSSVSAYLKSNVPRISPNVDVVVRVYANLQGLAKVYRDAGVTHDASELEQFVRGFNIGHPMCDMVDAGNGKECADDKIKENFKLHLADVHCKHILFGGSADNGYARLLGPYSADASANTRITLLEGPPFASELRDLLAAQAFASTALPDLFRSTKIVVPRRVPSPLTPPVSPIAKGAAPGNYASAAALNNNSSGNVDVVPTAITTTTGKASTAPACPPLLAFNALNQRIDAPLPYSATLFTALKAKKLCNPYHLLGACHYTHCSHGHGAPLSAKQLLALRQVARLAPCEAGLECRDELCIAGHRCPFGAACRGAACRFGREMHGVDTVIVRVVGGGGV